jgi:hypothetical protein
MLPITPLYADDGFADVAAAIGFESSELASRPVVRPSVPPTAAGSDAIFDETPVRLRGNPMKDVLCSVFVLSGENIVIPPSISLMSCHALL